MRNARFQAHFATCEGCRREADELSRSWATLGSLPEPDPSTAMRLRFYDSLREWSGAKRTGGPRLWWWRHPAFQAASAVAHAGDRHRDRRRDY